MSMSTSDGITTTKWEDDYEVADNWYEWLARPENATARLMVERDELKYLAEEKRKSELKGIWDTHS
jgi:hypothetical protein